MGRCTRQTRKAVRFAAYGILRAVRAPLDRDERTRQRGQRPPTRWCEREALWGTNANARGSGVLSGEYGGVGVEEGACVAYACVEVFEERVVDHP
jgi:hypothetical protein